MSDIIEHWRRSPLMSIPVHILNFMLKKILSLTFAIKWEYQNIKTFLQHFTFSLSKEVLVIKYLKKYYIVDICNWRS